MTSDPIENFMLDVEDYYGKYKAQHRDVVKQYVTKRFFPDDFQLLKKYIYENLHANYGAPTVSGFKKAASTAYSEDGVIFKKPTKTKNGRPLAKCRKCNKVFAMDLTTCPWCSEKIIGVGIVSVPKGYFD